MDTPAPQSQESKSEDRFDAMALIAGPIAGLRPEQLPGLAHIFRQIAKDEREACAALADKQSKFSGEDHIAKTPLAKTLDEQQMIDVASAMRHQADYIALMIRQRKVS